MSASKPPSDRSADRAPPEGAADERRTVQPDAGANPAPGARPAPARSAGDGDKRVCIARIGAPHGVRGALKLWAFTEDPLAILDYGPLTTKDGHRRFEVETAREANGHLVATLEGVASRNDAERLNGVELYIDRDQLPDTDEGEFYHADLIGLAAETTAGETLGRVIAIHNFGAGDILEIAPPSGPTLLLPFSTAVVPTIDVAGGRLLIEPPGEIEGDTPDHPEA